MIEFIKNVGDSHANALHGRLPNYKDSQVMFLPTYITKAKVFREYHQQTCQCDNRTSVDKSNYHHLWSQLTPFIVTMKPADDLCFDCQKLSSVFSRSGHLSEEEKVRKLQLYHPAPGLSQTGAYYLQRSDVVYVVTIHLLISPPCTIRMTLPASVNCLELHVSPSVGRSTT